MTNMKQRVKNIIAQTERDLLKTIEQDCRLITTLKTQRDNLLDALKGDEENCVPNVPMILSQALLGNYEAVKVMLRELCSINAEAIAKAESL